MSHKEEQRKRSLALLRRKEAKAKRAAQHEANRLAKLKRKERVKFDQDLKFAKNQAKAKRSPEHKADRGLARLKRNEHVKFDQDLKFAKNDESIGEEEGDDMSMKSKASKESSTGK